MGYWWTPHKKPKHNVRVFTIWLWLVTLADWLRVRPERSFICSHNISPQADYGLCKLEGAWLCKFKRIEMMKALKTIRESEFKSEPELSLQNFP